MDCLFDIYCNIFYAASKRALSFTPGFPVGWVRAQAVYAGEKPAHRCRYLAAYVQT